MKKRVNIYISEDTANRLKQYAAEQNSNVSQVITDMILEKKVRTEKLRSAKGVADVDKA